MNTKTIKTLLFSICVYYTQFSYAQLTPKVIQHFPAHIVCALNDLNAKIKLTEDKQMQIGQRLFTNDSLANVNKSIQTLSTLENYYSINKTTLLGILDTNELENFMYQKDKDNRFLVALVNAAKLKLEPNQINELRKENDNLETQTNKTPNSRMAFYRSKLNVILTKPQYVNLTKEIYAEESLAQTSRDWQGIKRLKVLNAKDTTLAYSQLYDYNLRRNSYLDEKGEKFDALKIADMKNRLVLEQQPSFLMHKKIMGDNLYQNNLFATALRFEKFLSLTAAQVDSLLAKSKSLEILKFIKKGNNQTPKANGIIAFENDNVPQILTPRQVTILFAKKNEKAAYTLAQENWKQVEQQNWTTGLDKNTAVKEFAHYQLQSLIAKDRLNMNNNQANLFFRRDVELKKPELLKRLDEIKTNEANVQKTKNGLKW